MTVKQMIDALNDALKHGVLPDSDVQVIGEPGADLIKSVAVNPATCTSAPAFVIEVGNNFSFGSMTP